MLSRGGTIRLQIPSNYELLDFIQLVCDRLASLAGPDEFFRLLEDKGV